MTLPLEELLEVVSEPDTDGAEVEGTDLGSFVVLEFSAVLPLRFEAIKKIRPVISSAPMPIIIKGERLDFREASAGEALICCGSVCLGSGITSVACGSNGALSKEPSAKQKVKVSSKVRLHVGQLFIGDWFEIRTVDVTNGRVS
jgi:hypothetical protein